MFSKLDLEVAEQLWAITWDGDLISKASRDLLVQKGLARRAAGGHNVLTDDGIRFVLAERSRRGDTLGRALLRHNEQGLDL